MMRQAILDQASERVCGDRPDVHGPLENSFGMIAAIWSVKLGVEVSPEQVALMLIDLKGVRAWGNPAHHDSWVDLAGYAACGGELSQQKTKPEQGSSVADA